MPNYSSTSFSVCFCASLSSCLSPCLFVSLSFFVLVRVYFYFSCLSVFFYLCLSLSLSDIFFLSLPSVSHCLFVISISLSLTVNVFYKSISSHICFGIIDVIGLLPKRPVRVMPAKRPLKCQQNAYKMPAKCQQNASKMQQNASKMPAKCQQKGSKRSLYWNNISSDIRRRNLIRRQAQNIFFCK